MENVVLILKKYSLKALFLGYKLILMDPFGSVLKEAKGTISENITHLLCDII
jgi:hypothetical protein